MKPLFWKLLLALAALMAAGAALGAFASQGRDGWSIEEFGILSSLRLSELERAPADPSNAVEGDADAARLGKQMFADPRFSRNGSVSCASCHQPDKAFQDGLPVGQGVGTGLRRTMPLAAAGHAPFMFWDGRKDSLWAQALGPLEDQAEHGGSRLAYAHLVRAHYRTQYEALFGPLPALSKLPAEGGPLGTPAQRAAWAAMREDERREVSRVFANIGKAIAAYEKTLRYGESRLDRYIDGVVNADRTAQLLLNAQEKNGLRLFIGKAQCVTCHAGPLFTDQQFHNTGIAPRTPGRPDLGRGAALAALLKDEFNCLGPYSDARPEQCEELRFLQADDHALDGAFKVPGLRNAAARSPYMHAGQLASLREVVDHYRRAPAAAAGHSELKPLRLSESELRDLAAFLGALDSPIVEEAAGKRQ
ncbi:Cytochrome c551 peroxidase [Massilia sp. Bi118]|uniref:cytochrome-c peroxidase n=1 Tax=Massilia sp. Bi118 TaxID=2822346 RepID=UPI001D206931|nr:cytochrome c peroxidase [Massilia sp. Bi118]CAH0308571.1 Cytochrome c551 peroxidase [Massilia sp. Bi118]